MKQTGNDYMIALLRVKVFGKCQVSTCVCVCVFFERDVTIVPITKIQESREKNSKKIGRVYRCRVLDSILWCATNRSIEKREK